MNICLGVDIFGPGLIPYSAKHRQGKHWQISLAIVHQFAIYSFPIQTLSMHQNVIEHSLNLPQSFPFHIYTIIDFISTQVV